jgi:hypothetical protein
VPGFRVSTSDAIHSAISVAVIVNGSRSPNVLLMIPIAAR